MSNSSCNLDIHSLSNNPNFDFTKQIFSTNSDNKNMFFDDENDSPYNFANFDCSYISPFDEFESEGIIIMSLNIQSINAKFSEFKDLIATLVSNGTVPDIICLQELWRFPHLANFNLPGYKPLCYKLRSDLVQGGGGGDYLSRIILIIR